MTFLRFHHILHTKLQLLKWTCCSRLLKRTSRFPCTFINFRLFFNNSLHLSWTLILQCSTGLRSNILKLDSLDDFLNYVIHHIAHPNIGPLNYIMCFMSMMRRFVIFSLFFFFFISLGKVLDIIFSRFRSKLFLCNYFTFVFEHFNRN